MSGLRATELQERVAVPGVSGVHELHVWVLTSGKNALTAHVVHAAGFDGTALIEPLKEMLADRFKVFHTTWQVEPTACQHSEDGGNFVDHCVPANLREVRAGHVH